MNTLRAGTLRDRITVQRRKPGGGLGHPSNTWEDVLPQPLWANIRFGSGSETIRAGQVASKAQASIRIRWRTGITADMRCVSGGVVYEIKAVLPDRRRREYVDLVCEVTG
jgi:SPP1 family predicted phage head-tail adaptor